jgi:hypothetical protein
MQICENFTFRIGLPTEDAHSEVIGGPIIHEEVF